LNTVLVLQRSTSLDFIETQAVYSWWHCFSIK